MAVYSIRPSSGEEAAAWGATAMTSAPWRSNSFIWTVVDITCPIAMLRTHPLSIYLVVAVNALTYAMVGLGVESLRLSRAHR